MREEKTHNLKLEGSPHRLITNSIPMFIIFRSMNKLNFISYAFMSLGITHHLVCQQAVTLSKVDCNDYPKSIYEF